MTAIIYGIKNCDTMKKARAWLEEHGVAYDFHDYKAVGIDRAHLQQWVDRAGSGNRTQPRRNDLPQTAGRRPRKPHPGKGDRPDARPAVDDRGGRLLEAGGKLLVGFKPRELRGGISKNKTSKTTRATQVLAKAGVSFAGA